ncbi:hypothetical protein ARC20_17445 [Stenotrophomonas panacihumi]|uniref:HTH araC/xylS-type domain-containing protein n=2 Tax=Stenotrophomonas panacihumi TaxID=676599 RepID=A0A0R0ASB6_9GAMM|nr:DUF6597 domain-containing transcriptional factor [Stenotrophomonas panacihumi]KRG48070.1 hypothetical protein ARC20_17445 [Stenotrophomonas panacihumi]PTN54449.1 AraC family transcriptional regulator [Stenotrophomonas panacihumi]
MPSLPRYREVAPPAAWRHQVRRLWRYRAGDAPAPPTRILPDGCIDLIWDGSALFVAGPDRTAAMAAIAPGCRLTGVRLAPGAAHGLFGAPMEALAGQRVDLRTLWGSRADGLEDRLRDAGTSSAHLLLDAVAQRAAVPDRRMAWLFARLSAGDAPRLPRLASELGTSERALRRHCLVHFGYGPKTLDRILRLQRLLALAPRSASLTDAALAAGYADAAHLVHDARDLTRLSPTELVREHGR